MGRPRWNAARDAQIVADAAAGASRAVLAARYQITVVRVGQVLADAARAPRREAADAAGRAAAAGALAALPAPSPSRPGGRGVPRRWTGDDARAALRAAAALHPGPLTRRGYDRMRAAGLLTGPPGTLVAQRAGGWAAALHAAGLPAAADAAARRPAWTDDQLRGWAEAAVADGVVTTAAYTLWARSRKGAPSATALTTRLGPWRQVQAQAAASLAAPPAGQPRPGEEG